MQSTANEVPEAAVEADEPQWHATRKGTDRAERKGFEKPPCAITTSSGKEYVLLEKQPDMYIQVPRKRPPHNGSEFDIISDTAFIEGTGENTEGGQSKKSSKKHKGRGKQIVPKVCSGDDWILVTQSPKKK